MTEHKAFSLCYNFYQSTPTASRDKELRSNCKDSIIIIKLSVQAFLEVEASGRAGAADAPMVSDAPTSDCQHSYAVQTFVQTFAVYNKSFTTPAVAIRRPHTAKSVRIFGTRGTAFACTCASNHRRSFQYPRTVRESSDGLLSRASDILFLPNSSGGLLRKDIWWRTATPLELRVFMDSGDHLLTLQRSHYPLTLKHAI
ncbi:hypothetical protein EVAR_9313_1 [Eumeta japonica]|uniref:Uncharacterized protein n=1 Tax=Eumeta variegata TaxID=151549 RepID=A0A4C1TNU2_EUMVA|nr:hypothetical protein EVAR_9313_1 [Eumeta japonica]